MKNPLSPEVFSMIRAYNSTIILNAGLPLVDAIGSNQPDPVDLPQFILKSGRIIAEPRLSVKMSHGLASISLDDHDNGQTMADCTLDSILRVNSTILSIIIAFRTYDDFEGAGFARSLFALADALAPKVARTCPSYDTAVAVVEDTAYKRSLFGTHTGWTTAHAKQLGYSDDPDFLDQFGLNFKTRSMLVKLIS